jgi:hypothetical protein
VLSHPTPNGGRQFTAFRGSIGINTDEGYREVHVGMRSGQSLPIADLNLKPGQLNRVRVSLVYPADATPGHLLSVVPESQLAMAQQRQRQLDDAQAMAASRPARSAPPPPTAQPEVVLDAQPIPAQGPTVVASEPSMRPSPRPASRPKPTLTTPPGWLQPLPALPAPPGLPPATINPTRMSQSLLDRYQQAVDAQKQFMKMLMGR